MQKKCLFGVTSGCNIDIFFSLIECRGKNNASKGCTMILLESWGTENANMEALVKALVEMRHIRAAHYLQVEVMGGKSTIVFIFLQLILNIFK